MANLEHRILMLLYLRSEHKSFVPHSIWRKQGFYKTFFVKESNVFLFYLKVREDAVKNYVLMSHVSFYISSLLLSFDERDC